MTSYLLLSHIFTIFRKWNILSDLLFAALMFSHYFFRMGNTFVTFCLLPVVNKPFYNRDCSFRKKFASTEANSSLDELAIKEMRKK